MQKNETARVSKKSNEGLVIAFQKFNGVFLAKISNRLDRETFAYGSTEKEAGRNAVRNYRRKYYHTLQTL